MSQSKRSRDGTKCTSQPFLGFLATSWLLLTCHFVLFCHLLQERNELPPTALQRFLHHRHSPPGPGRLAVAIKRLSVCLSVCRWHTGGTRRRGKEEWCGLGGGGGGGGAIALHRGERAVAAAASSCGSTSRQRKHPIGSCCQGGPSRLDQPLRRKEGRAALVSSEEGGHKRTRVCSPDRARHGCISKVTMLDQMETF